jgi:hypothetical protein
MCSAGRFSSSPCSVSFFGRSWRFRYDLTDNIGQATPVVIPNSTATPVHSRATRAETTLTDDSPATDPPHTNPYVFETRPRWTDVYQNPNAGLNCWLVSAMKTLAYVDPRYIEILFNADDWVADSGTGVYHVTLPNANVDINFVHPPWKAYTTSWVRVTAPFVSDIYPLPGAVRGASVWSWKSTSADSQGGPLRSWTPSPRDTRALSAV